MILWAPEKSSAFLKDGPPAVQLHQSHAGHDFGHVYGVRTAASEPITESNRADTVVAEMPTRPGLNRGQMCK